VEAFPFEYNKELKLFTFNNEWGFHDGSLQHMREGSFSRLSAQGTNI
jgi:hypothetical protein